MGALSDFAISTIRTMVPILVGGAVSFILVHFGFIVPPDLAAQAVVALTSALVAGYYLAVHALEQKFPQIGVLLGVAKRPVYPSLAREVPGEVV